VQEADDAIGTYRQALDRPGDGLNLDITSALNQMHGSIERANREISEGDEPAAAEDLKVAEELASRIRHIVGR
jgi:hypothetical protein